jgi:hypothetical protein
MSGRLAWTMLAAAAVGACRQEQAALVVRFGDAGCEGRGDLGCVNFIQFTVKRPGEFETRCLRVEQKLADLCGLEALAQGQELFQLDPSDTVTVDLKALRVFPATGCDFVPDCDPRVLVSGTTGEVQVGRAAGGAVDLPVKVREACGLPEEFFPLTAGRTCLEVCGTWGGRSLVSCDGVMGGCLCQVPSRPDAGVPDAR